MTRAFACSHLWQFTTIDRPNKREDERKDNQREQLIERNAGEGVQVQRYRPSKACVE